MTVFIISLAACLSAGLGCLQAINVTQGWRGRALLTSIVQSVAALTLYKVVPGVRDADAVIAYIVGNALGGQISMHVTRRRLTSS